MYKLDEIRYQKPHLEIDDWRKIPNQKVVYRQGEKHI